MVLQKRKGWYKKRGQLFSESTFFCPKNIVISIKIITFSGVHYPQFGPKVKMQTGGNRHGATIKK